MDGARAGGGMSPFVPMGLAPYLRALADYREEIALGMKAAANLHGTELDSDFWVCYQRGQAELRESAQFFDEMPEKRGEQAQKRRERS